MTDYIMPETDIDILHDLENLQSRYEEFTVYTDVEKALNKRAREWYKLAFRSAYDTLMNAYPDHD